jgi:antitoxin Phd
VHTWQLQEAKNKFSAVVDGAVEGEPQLITRHGIEVAVVLSVEDYRRLTSPRPRLIDALRRAPAGIDELDFSRDQAPAPEPLEL